MSRSRWLQLISFTPASRRALVTLFLILLVPSTAFAFDFTDADVTEENGIFYIKFSAVIEAHPDYIRYVLNDSAHIYRLSPSIIESEVLPATPTDEKQVRTRLLNCTTVFCKEIERVDFVRMLPSGDFEAEIVPSLSEFKSGKATWKIIPMDDYSYVTYEAFLEPDFFIPPMLGTQMVIQILRDEFTATFVRIEKIARINQIRDRDANLVLTDSTPRRLSVPCSAQASASLQ